MLSGIRAVKLHQNLCQGNLRGNLTGKASDQGRREGDRDWGTWIVCFSLDVPAKGGGARDSRMGGTLGGRESRDHVDGSRKA